MSQKALAAKLTKEDGQPISAQYLNDIEHDRRNAPEYLIVQLAKELGVSLDRLFVAAGTLPPDIREDASVAQEEAVKAAFVAFRRELKRQRK